jgi:hypothetical protein
MRAINSCSLMRSSFDMLILRQAQDDVIAVMVSLSNHGRVWSFLSYTILKR